MVKYTLYVAYGSNLNVPQMEQRCPDAEIYGVGRIEDYRLVFKGLGVYSYATIEPYDGEYVPVAVWRISARDEARLDRYEGYPMHYQKHIVKVVLSDGGVVGGMVYIMDARAMSGVPTRSYFDCVLMGYNSFGLDVQKLYQAWFLADGGSYCDGSTLKYYRERKGLTQTQLSEKSGVGVGSIQKYETGERNIKTARACTVLRVAQALGISPYLLMN